MKHQNSADLLNLASSSVTKLKQAHAYLLRRNLLLPCDNPLSSLLLSLYAAISSPFSAFSVAISIPNPSLNLFNHAIRALSKSPLALCLYSRMPGLAISPDNFTFPFALNSCAANGDLSSGYELHSRLLRTGFAHYLPVANSLVDMYGKCAQLDLARCFFEEMPFRDIVSNNAMLGAYARFGEDMVSARKLFDDMPHRNAITWNGLIVGYVNGGDVNAAREIFDRIPSRDTVSWTVMVVGYSRAGMMDDARELFDEMPQKNSVLWTVMISSYAQCGRPKEAVSFFKEMQTAGVEPDAATMTSVISAVSQLGDVGLSRWIDDFIDQSSIERNERVLTAQLDMHAKCGNVKRAFQLFDEIPSPDAYSYTALINGLASNGRSIEALKMFEQMRANAIPPHPITFIGVLSACSHAGLVEDGLRFWNSMPEKYGIEPCSDHYACMVDMLGRAGRLEEAYEIIRQMPEGAHAGALGAMLGACRTYGNVEIAETVAKELFVVEPENTGNYILLSSIYAEKGLWAKAVRVRKMMRGRGAEKMPGFSWI